MRWVIRPIAFTALPVEFCTSRIWLEISSVAFAVCTASDFTSEATTAHTRAVPPSADGPRKPLKADPLGSLLGRWLEKAQVRRPVLNALTHLRSEGNEGAIMPISADLRARLSCALPRIFTAILLTAFGAVCPAASIHGVVTDASGAKVIGANVVLVSKGKVASSAISGADGSFQILTGATGRLFLRSEER